MKINKTFVISLTMMAIMLLMVGPASAVYYLDSDNDGTANAVEIAMGWDPSDSWSPMYPESIDLDQDGLDDNDETLIYGTDPFFPDTDEDGISDGAELFETYTDPLNSDTDGDGIWDGVEIAMMPPTDPLDPDSPVPASVVDDDYDGISNYVELYLIIPMFSLPTDPSNPDTDGDWIDDGDEILSGTNPTNPDTDEDGIIDGDEGPFGLDTDPLNPDTDGDGTKDGAEDYDGDGVSNTNELYLYGTDPKVPDTDGDGISDGDEISTGTDPLDSTDPSSGTTPIPEFPTIALPVISLIGLMFLFQRRTGK